MMVSRRGCQPDADDVQGQRQVPGAVLATLPGAHVTLDPPTVTLTAPSEDAVAADPYFGAVDGSAEVKIRLEQSRLRKILANGRQVASCALCGHSFPIGFLIAAHIKKRALCTDDERRNLHHVAMLACTFGCDALYESGWITVAQNGLIQAARHDGQPDALRDRLQLLDGLRCAAHSDDAESYFAWHRTTIFRVGGIYEDR